MTPLTPKEKFQFKNAEICHLCEKRFFFNSDIQVKDLAIQRVFFADLHTLNCNLNYKSKNAIPVFFQNLSNYDSHLFIYCLAPKEETFEVVAQRKEKYVTLFLLI